MKLESGSDGITLTEVSKSFGSTRVLEDLDLVFPKGDFCTLLGPSGCGKTTLLRLIAGLENLDTGRIAFFGRDVSRLPVAQRNCSILFQSYALFPNLTVAANVGYGLRARGVPRAEAHKKVVDLLALVGLSGYEQRLPTQLSGGQQQRVALARALAVEPEVLLLDEPFSALDAQVRLHLRTEVRRLQKRLGVTTVMVTHDQDEALSVSDRIFLLLDGRVRQSGSPQEIYEHPVDAFAADFIGTANWLRGWRPCADGCFTKGDHSLRVATTEAVPEGPVALMVRPESFRIVRAGEESGEGLPAQIELIEYRGATERVVARIDGADADDGDGGEVQIDRAQSDEVIAVGDRVRLIPDPASIRIFSEQR